MRAPATVDLDEILRINEVAALLHSCRATVYRMLRNRQLPAFKLGSDWRFRRAAVLEWIKQQEQEPWTHSTKGRSPKQHEQPPALQG